MEPRLFLLLVATHIVLSLTPGPAVLGTVSRSLASGARRALPMVGGILAANLFYFLLSSTSVGALLIASYGVFSTVRWIGAGYLAWMGLSAIFGRHSTFAPRAAGEREVTPGRVFFNGVVLQLSNPKALVFFTALLPQFLNLHRPILPQMLIIAAVNVTADALALAGYAFLAARAAHLSERPRFRRVADTAAGLMLLSAAVLTAGLHRA